jgi:hypothetical protein
MRLDWFSPRKLALRFAAGQVHNREIAYLILGNLVFGSVIFYAAFTRANPPWTLLSLVECIIVITVTLIGFTKVYDAAGSDTNNSFAALFNCLSFGVWFWSTAIVWSVYWVVIWGFEYSLSAAYKFDRLPIAQNLVAIGGSFEWLWTFLATLLWQVIYFAWMTKAIAHTRK